MKKYEPISCDLYDVVEITALRKKVSKIEYLSEKGKKITIVSRILDTRTQMDGEFILLEDKDLLIRMDRILAIDGQPFKALD